MMNETILIVEDEIIVAEDIKRSLQNLGFSITSIVSSGEEAIKIAKEKNPDLVLMDIVLKGKIDGIMAAEQIRTKFEIPVVFLTAYADDKTLKRAKVTEPFGYIIKPFKEKELQISIEFSLYKHKMETQFKELKELYFTTLNSISDAVIASDRMNKITFMNPVAQILTGCKLEEGLGRHLNEIFIIKESEDGQRRGLITEIADEGVVISPSNQTILISRTGKEIPIEITGDPIMDFERNMLGSVVVFREVTEQEETKKP